jgi:hypothetical protein
MTRPCALGLLAATLGCVQEPSVPRIGEQPIELTISLSAPQVRRGEADTITVTVANHFEQTIQLLFPSTCQIRVYIRDATGRVVVPEGGSYACVPVPSRMDLPASGSVTRQFVWRGGSQFVPPGSSATLPAGQYYVTADMVAFDYRTSAFALRVTLTE